MEETKKVKPEQKKTILENNTALFIFLILELLFFLTFGLFKIDSIFRFFGVVLAVFCFPVLKPIFLDEKTQKPALVGAGLLFVYGALTAINPMVNFGDTLATISLFFAFLAFFLLGIAMAQLTEFKILYALLALFAGLALVLLLSLFVTFYAYNIFHIVRLQGEYIFLAGALKPISEHVKWLSGFEVRERTLNVPVLYVTLLLSMILPTILYFRKEKWPNRYAKWGMIGIVAIGVFGLLSLPLFKVLIYLLPSLVVVALLAIFPKPNRILKIVGYVALGGFAFLVLLGILYAFDVGFIVSLLNRIPLLNKVMAHSYIAPWLTAIRESTLYPFGTTIYLETRSYRPFVYTTQNYLLDTLRHTGIIPFLLLGVFTILAAYKTILYVRSDRDTPLIRTLITSYLVAYFTLVAFNYPFHQFAEITAETRMTDFFPFARSELWLIALFLLGYIYFPRPAGEETKEEKPIRKEKNKNGAIAPVVKIPTNKEENV
ncbi:MAG: hypothetical protein ACOX3K_01505 [Bacilli bacterium]